MKPKILIVDDDVDICILLQDYLNKNGFSTTISVSAKNAFDELKKEKYQIVFSDFRLGDKDGYEVLTKIKKDHPNTEVVIITGYSNIKSAVNLMKAGAFDYLSKPLMPEELLNIANDALKHIKSKNQSVTADSSTQDKNTSLHSHLEEHDAVFKGHSPAMKKLYQQVDLVATTDYSIILHGESGSGKEVIAKYIHQRSNRSSGPFIALDCGTLTRELSNSELFGHVKGSFTGAITDKKGHFELANGGTLFLDEIANLSYDIQAALLRVIQERKMKKIGGTKEINLDVRLIVASHEDLRAAYENNKFREDLFHRLNEFSIDIPPLRERQEDIQDMALFFLNRVNRETCKQIKGFDDEVLKQFLIYPWPGNVREMRNVIRRAVLLTSSDKISKEVLASELFQEYTNKIFKVNPEENNSIPLNPSHPRDLKSISREREYEAIIDALKSANFNKSEAAKLLKIDRKTLYNKLKEYNS